MEADLTDFESVAMFTAGEFDRLNHAIPGFESASKPYTTFWNDTVLLEYGRMPAEIEIRKGILSEIYAHDIYELASLEEFCHRVFHHAGVGGSATACRGLMEWSASMNG